MSATAIVLGAAVLPDGTASPALRRRAEEAARLFLAGRVSTIIASGGVPQGGRSEAELIREICVAQGVPSDAILCEKRSSNTLQNLQNSIPLLTGGDVILVTDRYHGARARLIAKDLGVTALVISPPLDRLSMRRLVRGYLRELAATLIYRVRRFTA